MSTLPPQTKKIPRPPGDRGQGRKPLPAEQKRTNRSIRMTDTEYKDFVALGGRVWLAEAIARAMRSRKKESPP